MIRVVLPVRTCEWFSFVLMIIILMAHVESISLNPDTVVDTWRRLAVK